MKKLIIARGLPGSGKSYKVSKLAEEYASQGYSVIICSSDNFLIDSDGVYKFKLDKLHWAHRSCQSDAKRSMDSGINYVFIDNTNVSARECSVYVKMGLERNYEIEFLEPSTDWAFNLDELEKRNQHSVPREALERMSERWVYDMTVEKALGKQNHGTEHEDEKAADSAAKERAHV